MNKKKSEEKLERMNIEQIEIGRKHVLCFRRKKEEILSNR